jgi:hypothetical protein
MVITLWILDGLEPISTIRYATVMHKKVIGWFI